MTKILIRTLLIININAIKLEAEKLGKTFREGINDGLTNVFFIEPNLSANEKTVFLGLINKIGTGTVT